MADDEIDDWMDQRGALIGVRSGNGDAIDQAFAAAFAALGYTAVSKDDAADREVVHLQRYAEEDGAWVLAEEVDPATAREIACKVAISTGASAWMMAARATYRLHRRPACTFEATEATVDPRGAIGGANPSAVEEIEWSKEDLQTDKPWRLVELALSTAMGTWGVRGTTPRETTHWKPPAKLDSPRLEALARLLRAGATSERVVVAGREALRVRSADGTVSTSFLSGDELACLAAACPTLRLA